VDHVAPTVAKGSIGQAPFLNTPTRNSPPLSIRRDVDPDSDTVTGLAEPQRVDTLDVNCNFLSILGVHPALGRDLQPRTTRPRVATP